MAQKGNGSPQQSGPQQTQPPPRRPAGEFRYGLCRASVWANPTDQGGTRYSVSLQRSYKDGDGQWQTTQSLNRDDVPLMIQALTDAYRFMYAPKEREPGDEG